MVDMRLSVFQHGAPVSADSGAGSAADAERGVDDGLALPVLLHLAGAGAAAHAEVFQRTAEACLFMALEMAQRDDDVGIHDGLADLGFLYQREIDGDKRLIGAFEAVGNDHMAARLQRGEAVEIGGIHMVKGVLAAADIECVAVGEEDPAAELTNVIRNHFCVLRAQIRQVAELAEVNLDGGVAVGKADLLKAGTLHQAVQLLRQRLRRCRMEVRKVDL